MTVVRSRLYRLEKRFTARDKDRERQNEKIKNEKGYYCPCVSSITWIVLEGVGFLCPGFCRNPHAPATPFPVSYRDADLVVSRFEERIKVVCCLSIVVVPLMCQINGRIPAGRILVLDREAGNREAVGKHRLEKKLATVA